MKYYLKKLGAFALAAIMVATFCMNSLSVSAKTVSYTVQPGDTLGKIAQKAGVPVVKLQKESGIEDPNKIYVGQNIAINLSDVTEAGQKWVADQQVKGNVVDGIVNNKDYKKVGKSIAGKVELPKGTTLAREELGFLYETFDEEYYAALYPDVKAALGTDKIALLQHWITYGSNEGREITAEFSVNAYISANKDIQKAFDGGMIASLVHYYEFGQYEERITTVEEAVAAGVTVTTPSGAVVATPTVPKTEVVAAPTTPTPPSVPSEPACYHLNFHCEADVPGDTSDEFDLLCCDDCDFTMPVGHDWMYGSCSFCNKPHDHTGEAIVVDFGNFTTIDHFLVYEDCYGDAGSASHNWSFGVCDDCGYICEHPSMSTNVKNDTVHEIACASCDYRADVVHNYGEDHRCSDCNYSHSTSTHTYADGVCTICGYRCAHDSTRKVPVAGNDDQHNIVCTVCNEIVGTENHNYEWGGFDHSCTICGHVNSVTDHIYHFDTCTICGFVCLHESVRLYHPVDIDGVCNEHDVFCSSCGILFDAFEPHEYNSDGICEKCGYGPSE